MSDKLVTLAIHTYDYAVALRDLLQRKGIQAHLDNVNIAEPNPACGVRVRISEKDLPAALRIVETEFINETSDLVNALDGVTTEILLPIDLAADCMNVVSTAFALASAGELKVKIMHVYTTPYFDGSLSITDNFTLDVRDSAMRMKLGQLAAERMKSFTAKLDEIMAAGNLPKVKYSSVVLEGIPEDLILDYCRRTPPELVVMGTRSVSKKASEMLGSVAAEVVDGCRVPVLTVPEDLVFRSLSALAPSAFFCNVDQHDLIAMDIYMKLFGKAVSNVTLIPVSDKSGSKLTGRMNALETYFSEHYPAAHFATKLVDSKNLQADITAYLRQNPVKMLVVPNKKKNIFARLINPGIPHKVLFEADIPMLALPV
ncbi:MAG: universal stress protein [Bacteroidales bacterium]|nr:universal stress protein [Bacteroidales bacterium]